MKAAPIAVILMGHIYGRPGAYDAAPMTDLPPATALEAAAPDAATRRAFRVLFFIVLVDMIGFGILLPILPVYAKGFGASNLGVTLMFSVYSLCQFIASPILGNFSDRVGRRPILIFSQIGSGLALLTLAFATWKMLGTAAGLWVVYASRIIDGSSAGNLSAAQAYVSDSVAPQHRAKFMGLLGAVFGLGFALGPAVGGVLGHFNPAIAPLAAGLLSLTAAVLSYRFLPESLKEPVVHTTGHLSRSLALLRQPILTQINLIWFLSMFAFVMAESVFALFMSDDYHFGTLSIGFMFSLAGAVIICVQGGAIGPLTRRFGEWNVATAGPFVFAIGMAIYAVAAHHPVIWLLVVAVMWNATGRSLQTPSLSAIISHQSPPGQQGAAFGLFQGFGSLARVGGPALAGALYDHRHFLPYAVACGLTLVSGLWTIALRRQRATLAAA